MGIDNIHQEVIDLFADWSEEDISIKEIDQGRAATVALGLDLIGTSASHGGNAASAILNTITGHYGLSVERLEKNDRHPPTWRYLLVGNEIRVTALPSWEWLSTINGEFVTVATIVAATGLSVSRVRERIRLWIKDGQLEPSFIFGPHGALFYPLNKICELSSGTRRYNKSRN